MPSELNRESLLVKAGTKWVTSTATLVLVPCLNFGLGVAGKARERRRDHIGRVNPRHAFPVRHAQRVGGGEGGVACGMVGGVEVNPRVTYKVVRVPPTVHTGNNGALVNPSGRNAERLNRMRPTRPHVVVIVGQRVGQKIIHGFRVQVGEVCVQ